MGQTMWIVEEDGLANGSYFFFVINFCCVLLLDKNANLTYISLQILDTNPQLFFHLQQQRLIELIRNGKVEEALEFAQEELAPRGEENVTFDFYTYFFSHLNRHYCHTKDETLLS